MEIREGEPNCFGGIGLMVEHPQSRIRFLLGPSTLESLQIVGAPIWRDRIVGVCENWLAISGSASLPLAQIEIDTLQPPHLGLGSGTQISSLIAHALIAAAKSSESPIGYAPDPEELTRTSGRGGRSHIGMGGYLMGGAIVDYGQQAMGNRVRREAFPDWPILLIQCDQFTGVHGERERMMFQHCSGISNPNRVEMLQIVEQELVPAIRSGSWNRWDQYAGVYGYLAGKIFEEVQGGAYRTPSIAALVSHLRDLGCQGAAQSSWGPTVMVVAQDTAHASSLVSSLKEAFPSVGITITAARNKPAEITLGTVPK